MVKECWCTMFAISKSELSALANTVQAKSYHLTCWIIKHFPFWKAVNRILKTGLLSQLFCLLSMSWRCYQQAFYHPAAHIHCSKPSGHILGKTPQGHSHIWQRRPLFACSKCKSLHPICKALLACICMSKLLKSQVNTILVYLIKADKATELLP